jgi:hypothetical protein
MRFLLRNFLGLIGLPGDVQTIFTYVLPWLGLSVVSGTLVGLAEGLGWAIFAGTGVLAFGMVALGRFHELRNENRLQYKLIPSELEITQVLHSTGNNRLLVDIRAAVENHANYQLWYDVQKYQVEVDGEIIQENVDSRPQVVPPMSKGFGVNPRTPIGEWLKPHNGRIRVAYVYGKSKKSMNMMLLVDYEFEIHQMSQPDDDVATGFAYRIHDMSYVRYEIKSEELE